MRLIDVNEFKKRIDRYPAEIRDIAKKELRYVPTIDAVEVIRCKDCRYFNKYGFKLEYTECLHFDCDVSEDGYCAWGAKREGVDE